MVVHRVLRFAFIMACVASQPAVAQDASVIALPRIDVVPVEGGLSVEGHVIGVEAGSVEATLALIREDASGRTATRQSRTIDVSLGSGDAVARMQISAMPGSRVEITLTLSRDGTAFAIAETRLGSTSEFHQTDP
jgi:hypothetical protein